MFRITIICQGRLKEKYYIDACEEYLKRLGGFCRAEVIELTENGDPMARVPKGAYLIALCIEGSRTTSEGLASRLAACGSGGHSRLCFLIGGSEGLPEEARRAADWRLSMSDMTFPHHLARVMLLEQLYRAFMILAGTKYHK